MSALLDRYNLLLDQLNLPLNLKSISLATPTLLLSTLEAILGTRIIDVPTSWRARIDYESRKKVVDVLLRALDEVTEGIRARAGEMRAMHPPDWDVEGITLGDEAAVAAVLQSLLDIAKALDVVDSRARQTRNRDRVAVVDTEMAGALTPKPPTSPRKLFSPRPLRRHDPAPNSPARPRTALSDSPLVSPTRRPNPSTRPPSTTLSEPAPLDRLERDPPFTTPNRRQRPATSFLAELVRTSSPNGRDEAPSSGAPRNETGLPRLGSPPVSPRKSIVQVMRTLDLGRTERARAERTLPASSEFMRTRDRRSTPDAATRADKAAREPHGRHGSLRRRRRARKSEGPSSDTSDSSLTGSSSSLSSDSSPWSASGGKAKERLYSTGTCTCAHRPLASRTTSTTHKSPKSAAPSVAARMGDSAEIAPSPVFRPSRRTRVSRMPNSSPGRNKNDADEALLSVHSSTDIEATLSGPPMHQLSTPLATRQLCEAVNQTPSPYTLLLLAERDRLREKLKLLEWRELDRKAAATAAHIEVAATASGVLRPTGCAQDCSPSQVAASTRSV